MKRIETTVSRTAEWTCVARAFSSAEPDGHCRCDDQLACQLLPWFLRPMVKTSAARAIFKRMAPDGLYHYVVARTKYIDDVCRRALAQRFSQILIFGAGFDTRALRFQQLSQDSRIFELDVPVTQNAKLAQYQKRNLVLPQNLTFIPIDFDRDSLSSKLTEAGFQKGQKSLFVLEGLLMYLQPESVDATFRTIQEYGAEGSWAVFDYVYASVLRGDNQHDPAARARRSVAFAGEKWHFGIERGKVGEFLSNYGMDLLDEKDAQALEETFFKDEEGRIIARVNGLHCLLTAERVGKNLYVGSTTAEA